VRHDQRCKSSDKSANGLEPRKQPEAHVLIEKTFGNSSESLGDKLYAGHDYDRYESGCPEKRGKRIGKTKGDSKAGETEQGRDGVELPKLIVGKVT